MFLAVGQVELMVASRPRCGNAHFEESEQELIKQGRSRQAYLYTKVPVQALVACSASGDGR